MIRYKVNVTFYSGDSLGVKTSSNTSYKFFENERAFYYWEKGIQHFDVDGSYGNVEVLEKKEIPYISKELLQHFVDLLNQDGVNSKKQVREELEYIIKSM